MYNFNSKGLAGLSILALLTLSACATPLKSSVEIADHAVLGGFETYAWIAEFPSLRSSTVAPEVVNPLNEQRIRAAVEQELRRKGYRQVPAAEADFLLGYSIGARNRVRVQEFYDNFGFGYYGFHRGFSRFGGVGRSVSVRTITEGILVVDIFDNASREAIWHGAASKRISRDYGARELIDEAVADLLGQFPDRDMMPDVAEKLTS